MARRFTCIGWRAGKYSAGLASDRPRNFSRKHRGFRGIPGACWMRDVVHSLAAVYPRLSENALSIANDFLVWFLASHLSLISKTARERLAHVLVSLADGIGQQCPGGVRIDVTNEQLANTANITVFTASRLLREFQRSGAIMKSRGNILVCNPQRLFPKNGNLQIATG